MFKLRLYQSMPYSCPYIPSNTAHHYTTEPNLPLTTELYSQLINMGFRRAGDRIHKPNCSQCQQCVSLRIPVAKFSPNRTQRRISQNNSHLIIKLNTAPKHADYFALYDKYIKQRHPESESMHDIEDTFEHFFFCMWSHTFAIETYTADNQLICVAICDPLVQGWSAVYTFYDTDYAKNSLGTFSILSQIQLLQKQQLEYLYLGYWIRDCAKMNYKTQFQPCEGFTNEQWTAINDP